VSERVARSRELVARGFAAATVARVLRVSRQALYRVPHPRRPPSRRPLSDPVETAIVEEALANQTDGYRMVTAFVRRKLGIAVNRKRVLRVMRERKLIQRRRPLERRKRPGFFRVERPRQLWQLDLTSVWVAEHGWCYLMAAIDCCTREIVAWHLELRCRAEEAIMLVERAAALHAIEEGELTLGSDSGSAFTARRFRARLAELGIRHRRGGYRDPESQAFIESWSGKLKREGGVAERVRDPRQRPPRHRRLRRALPPPVPTRGWTTRRPWRCVRPGRIYRKPRPEPSTPAGSRSPPPPEAEPPRPRQQTTARPRPHRRRSAQHGRRAFSHPQATTTPAPWHPCQPRTGSAKPRTRPGCIGPRQDMPRGSPRPASASASPTTTRSGIQFALT
jgi:putative transposase